MSDGAGNIDQGAAIALTLLFVAVFLAVHAVANLVRFDDPVRRRLAGEPPHPPDQHRAGNGLSLRSAAIPPRRSWLPIGLSKILSFGGPQRPDRGVRARMIQAGITDSWAAPAYVLAQVGLGMGTPAVMVLLASDILSGLPPWQEAVLLMVAAAGGVLAPGFWLARRIARRQRSIAESFPDALDMMVVCVEAGLGLDAALARVGTQIAPAHPLLAGELELVTLALRAGKGRDDALRTFATRIALPQVASFVTLLVQSEALGASIAQTLRVHADDMRASRLLRAEEMAHKLPVKLTVPLVICILPAMLVAVLLPGMLSIARDVLPSLGQ